MPDIRQQLQRANDPSMDLDAGIWEVLQSNYNSILAFGDKPWPLTRSYDLSIIVLEIIELDWIVGNVNGHVGGTPYAEVGRTKNSYGATPLLSLWLGVMREIIGDERPQESL